MKNLKVFILGLNLDFQKSLINAFVNNSDISKVEYLDWRVLKNNYKLVDSYSFAFENKVLKKISEFKPDIVFTQISNNSFSDKFFMELGDYYVVNYVGDYLMNILKYFDYFKNIAERHNNVYTLFFDYGQVEEFNRNNIWAGHLPIGYEDWCFNESAKTIANFPSIIFIGNNYVFSKERFRMVADLNFNYKSEFLVVGSGWNSFMKSKVVPYKDTPSFYKSAKISIGINNYELNNGTSNRMFNCMGTGGSLYMPKYFKGIENMFENRKHLVWWKDLSELKENIDYYLKNEKERKMISKLGHKEVVKNHKWSNRVDQIIKLIKNQMYGEQDESDE